MKQTTQTTNLKRMSGAILLVLGLAACNKNEGSYSLLSETQAFKQSSGYSQRKIDILFVIDNSGSMTSSQVNLANNMSSFINRFVTLGFDYRIAVTTTEAWLGDPNNQTIAGGRYSATKDVYRSSGGVRILDPSNTTSTNFSALINQGVSGDGDERAFSSFVAALRNPDNATYGFPRAGAFLSIIILSDEDDFSGENVWGSAVGQQRLYNTAAPQLQPTSYYVSWLNTFMNGSSNYSVSAIYADTATCVTNLGPGRTLGIRYAEIVDQTKGIKGSLCSAFGETLTQITDNVLTLSSTFALDREPVVSSINVKVNGSVIPNSETNGWVYLADQNAVQFRGASIPDQGASIIIDYDPVRAKN